MEYSLLKHKWIFYDGAYVRKQNKSQQIQVLKSYQISSLSTWYETRKLEINNKRKIGNSLVHKINHHFWTVKGSKKKLKGEQKSILRQLKLETHIQTYGMQKKHSKRHKTQQTVLCINS